MAPEYAYPGYGIGFTHDMLARSVDIVVRLLDEVGFCVPHDRLREMIRKKPGVSIRGDRICFAPQLTRSYIEKLIAAARPAVQAREAPGHARGQTDWVVRSGGFSMAVIDIETEEIRDATCQDLRDLIKLVNSFGCGGAYPVMPQDLPPLMRAIACFKICWEMSENIHPFDYQQPEQTRFIYEMHKVMGKTFTITLCVPKAMTIDPKDVDVFLSFYPDWKKNRDIDFSTLSYAMIGITKPVTATGCATMMLAEKLAVHMLFNLFDEEIEVPVGIVAGFATDLRSACWAWGSPRQHLFHYLSSGLMPALCGYELERYRPASVRLESSSCGIDEQAALEKMGSALLGALQGARTFSYAGSLCVDDLYSGVQFVIDLEIVNYIRELVEAFDPHPDILSMDGLYELIRDVSIGKETFISSSDTVRKFRNIVPSSQRLFREKLRAWMSHRKSLKDRAREEAIERIRTFEPYRLPDDRQKELDAIYARAEASLAE